MNQETESATLSETETENTAVTETEPVQENEVSQSFDDIAIMLDSIAKKDLDTVKKLKKWLDENDTKPDENWFIQDRKAFFKSNPYMTETEFENLINDEDFKQFADGKIGFEPLGKIYEGYKNYVKKIDELATQKAEKMFLKKISSPGSLNATGVSSLKWQDMSEQEFERAISNAKKGYYSNKNN